VQPQLDKADRQQHPGDLGGIALTPELRQQEIADLAAAPQAFCCWISMSTKPMKPASEAEKTPYSKAGRFSAVALWASTYM
jgi:hypothetical protein